MDDNQTAGLVNRLIMAIDAEQRANHELAGSVHELANEIRVEREERREADKIERTERIEANARQDREIDKIRRISRGQVLAWAPLISAVIAAAVGGVFTLVIAGPGPLQAWYEWAFAP